MHSKLLVGAAAVGICVAGCAGGGSGAGGATHRAAVPGLGSRPTQMFRVRIAGRRRSLKAPSAAWGRRSYRFTAPQWSAGDSRISTASPMRPPPASTRGRGPRRPERDCAFAWSAPTSSRLCSGESRAYQQDRGTAGGLLREHPEQAVPARGGSRTALTPVGRQGVAMVSTSPWCDWRSPRCG